MIARINARNHREYVAENEHLTLGQLRARQVINRYLYKRNIPFYPCPDFHIRQLQHDTDLEGLTGIWTQQGFRDPNPSDDSLLWWGLSVTSEEMKSAMRRYLMEKYPDREVQAERKFLKKFASSPAFKRSSRLGSYRFIIPLDEMLSAYKEQFCGGAEPVMRVKETVIYRQEVMYVILVHSPANEEQFLGYPYLPDDFRSVCAYRYEEDGGDAYIRWRSQAMCKTHRFRLILDQVKDKLWAKFHYRRRPEWFVWDNVAIALHVGNEVLRFDRDQLKDSLRYCDRGSPIFTHPNCFEDFYDAKVSVSKLFGDYQYRLRRA